VEADKLKDIVQDGSPTKVVVLGIGTGVDMNELNNMASAPQNNNVISVSDFSSLSNVEEQLRDASCDRQYLSLISVRYNKFFWSMWYILKPQLFIMRQFRCDIGIQIGVAITQRKRPALYIFLFYGRPM